MTNLSPGHIGLPPPERWTLIDGEHVVGWTTENAVGFRGFANETEAVHAAWVAYRTLAQRTARTVGTRPIPVDTERLAIRRRGEYDSILAGGRVIATLIRPGAESPSGPASFGFEIEIPQAADDLHVRAMAHVMYRTLRRSGHRWALWRSNGRRDAASSATPGSGDQRVPAPSDSRLTTSDGDAPRRRRNSTLPVPPWRRSRRPSRRQRGDVRAAFARVPAGLGAGR